MGVASLHSKFSESKIALRTDTGLKGQSGIGPAGDAKFRVRPEPVKARVSKWPKSDCPGLSRGFGKVTPGSAKRGGKFYAVEKEGQSYRSPQIFLVTLGGFSAPIEKDQTARIHGLGPYSSLGFVVG